MKKRLAKALEEAGLGVYKVALEKAEISDVETMESLTEEDWGEIGVGSEVRRKFGAVMEGLKERRVKEAWRPAGKAKGGGKKRGESPGEEAARLDIHRAALRKQKEVLLNPAATPAERQWASTPISYSSSPCSPPVVFAGARHLLKPGDTVRVISTPSRLWKTAGAVNSRTHPHAALMCGKTGVITSVEGEAFLVKFEEGSVKIPPDGLELLSTRFVSKQDVERVFMSTPRKQKRAKTNVDGSPEVVGVAHKTSPPPAKKKPTPKGVPPKPPTTPKKDPSNTHSTSEVENLRKELEEANKRLRETETVRVELKQLLDTFVGISRTLASSSTVWAEQLAASHPQSSSLAAEMATANQSLTDRLLTLEKELSF